MIFAGVFDILSGAQIDFGSQQLSVLIVSACTVAMGLRKIMFPEQRHLDGLLLFIYLSGVLFMGLKPFGPGSFPASNNLNLFTFMFDDFAINVAGFIPFGYITAIFFSTGGRFPKRANQIWPAVVFCLSVSLFIEITQYFIPGRSPSILDILFNLSGTIVGVGFYSLEKNFSHRPQFNF